MKTDIGLQFSLVVRRVARAAGWVAVTMALGLILDIVCGRPVAALTPSEVTSPGTDHTKKTGPWIYMPDLTRV